MARYRFNIKVRGRWRWLCDIEAKSHAAAFRKAMLGHKPEHFDKPIRLEQAGNQRDKRHEQQSASTSRCIGLSSPTDR